MPKDAWEGVSPIPWVPAAPVPQVPQVPQGVTRMLPGIRFHDTAPSFWDVKQPTIPAGSFPITNDFGNVSWTVPDYFLDPTAFGSYPMMTALGNEMWTMPDYFQ